MQTDLSKLKKIIREANKEISINRPLRLADVLLTVENQAGSIHYWAGVKLEVVEKWNLKETFDNQSDETKQFLTDLLVKPL